MLKDYQLETSSAEGLTVECFPPSVIPGFPGLGEPPRGLWRLFGAMKVIAVRLGFLSCKMGQSPGVVQSESVKQIRENTAGGRHRAQSWHEGLVITFSPYFLICEMGRIVLSAVLRPLS